MTLENWRLNFPKYLNPTCIQTILTTCNYSEIDTRRVHNAAPSLLWIHMRFLKTRLLKSTYSLLIFGNHYCKKLCSYDNGILHLILVSSSSHQGHPGPDCLLAFSLYCLKIFGMYEKILKWSGVIFQVFTNLRIWYLHHQEFRTLNGLIATPTMML